MQTLILIHPMCVEGAGSDGAEYMMVGTVAGIKWCAGQN